MSIKLAKDVVVGVVTVGSLLVCLVALFLLTTWEPSNFSRGSLAHVWKIPSHIDEELVWDTCIEPVYNYRMRDGESPEIIMIAYGTSVLETALEEQIDRFGERNECTFLKREPSNTTLRCATEGLREVSIISAKTNDECRKIVIDVFTGK